MAKGSFINNKRAAIPAIAAFTLIEMSIVLVIIGLIIGGVLAGRDLLHTQKVRRVIEDVSQIKSSTAAFELKFSALPGDMADAFSYWGIDCGANAAACNGNGDRKIGTPYNERWFAWRHMNLAKVYPGNYTGVADLTWTPSVAVPEGPFPGTVYHWEIATWVGNNREGLQLLFYASDAGGGSAWANSALIPADAWSIDVKVDNGNPRTGKMLVAGGYNGVTATSDPNCHSGNNYDLDHDEPSCRLEFVMEAGGVE